MTRQLSISIQTVYPSVLVLGVVPSLTWMVARCIKRAGRAPTVLAWHGLSPMMASGDCRSYHRWQGLHKVDSRLSRSSLDQVRELCRSHAIDVVIGADLDAALLLATCGSNNGIPCGAVPSSCTLSALNNKWVFHQHMVSLGLPVPESVRIADAAALPDHGLPYPIVTKPLDKWASVGFHVHHDHAQLMRKLAGGKLTPDFPLIAQRFVPGWDVGASFLAREGRLVAYSLFHHHRRGEREFFACPRLRRYLDVFTEATGYHGVGHLDLRYDPARDAYRFLELNPRFWASLLYASGAGLNYPDLLVRLPQLDRRIVHGATPGKVRLGPYERAMTLGNRWFGQIYERLTAATL